MKTSILFLCLSILLCGCYTESSLSRDELAPPGKMVYFYLNDGSYVRSYSGSHHRVEGGYQVSGSIFRRNAFPDKYDAIVPDNDIVRLGVDRLNVVGTLAAAGIGVGIVVFMINGFQQSFKTH